MSFAEDLAKASVLVLQEADEDRKAITIKLFNSVILDTPVDTGRARGNWQCTQNSPAPGETDRQDRSGSLAQNEVLEVILSSQTDSAVYLTNNLPYAQKLEFGYSGQAPEGMVRKNMARIQQILRETLSKK
tara:strand:- start:9868 stop:10260 length:393 start_codon:yes stop_codon:yes gene_type:complete